MTGEEDLSAEKAREAVLAWIKRADSLLGSAVLLEMVSPRGMISERSDAEALARRFARLATIWDEEFSKTWPLLGIDEADVRWVGGIVRGLGITIEAFPPLNDVFTTVDVEQTRNGCLVALTKLSKLVAVAEDESPRNIWPQTRQGRPSAEQISLEYFAERAKDGKTLPNIGAEAKAIALEVKKRIHSEYINIPAPAPRTIEDHIREKFNALKS